VIVMRLVVNMLDRWEKIDARHLAITLNRPFALPYMIPTILIVVRRRVGANQAELGTNSARRRPATGPFRIFQSCARALER